ncbi:multiple sugar transport system permease protein [Prauserella marina]|uniref:Multiple sugar transport system permease protein n=1 Tax=Prauserella marina TaxID=530584 RepID=A0A1G6RL27_9PSEU|nr:carbohydrate ABC transporter permease [Prauserella marina]PWV77130.1 carbohydrate ABC transporter membrane protein 2 (CUT1 family) [Prauserella marina]SDD05131.1 multiple sugar transport system permease protein [Prauserella marina]
MVTLSAPPETRSGRQNRSGGPRKRARTPREWGLLAISLAVLVVLLFPVYWMVMTSLVPSRELLTSSPPLVPPADTASFDAYGEVLSSRPVGLWLWNSALVTLGTALISVVISTLGGYSLSRFRTKAQQAMGFTLLFSRMLPGTLLIIPVFVIFASVGMINNLWSVILVNVAATVPFTTWLMKGFVDGIPGEIEEAAMIDGCGRLRTLWTVVLPLLRPGLATTFTYASILAWGDFLFARTLMPNPSDWTITVGIASFIGEHSVDWSGLMAAGLMSTLPMLVLFVFLEPFLVKGTASGAVKG